MTQPGELQVAETSIRHAAGIWNEQSAALKSASATVGDMSLTRIEAGIFQIIVGPYDAVMAQVSARCAEGSRTTHNIATALELSAYAYEEAEEATISNINRAFALQGR